MKIRQETPADYAEVYELVKISFATSTCLLWFLQQSGRRFLSPLWAR